MSTLIDSTLVGESYATVQPRRPGDRVLVLGVGNLLMGDEGVGIHVLRELELLPRMAGVQLLDGGTGGINLLAEMDGVPDVVLVDATRDGRLAGTIVFMEPEVVDDIPRGLSAHDFGVKDLFAAAALMGQLPRLHLFTISVEELHPMCTQLSPQVAEAVPCVVAAVHELVQRLVSESKLNN